MRTEFDEQWKDFRRQYEKVKLDLIEEDWTRAHHVWRLLDFEQKTQAMAGIKARLEGGYWTDSTYVPMPEKYLREDRKRPILARGSAAVARPYTDSHMSLEEQAERDARITRERRERYGIA